MFTRPLVHPFGSQIQRMFIILALLIILVAGIPLAQAVRTIPQVQPQLLALATQHPEGRLNVIVQKLPKDGSVEQLVTNLGGVVTKDLHIINAFAADVPARAVLTLAQAAGVRWISLNAATRQSATTGQFTTWATTVGTSIPATFTNAAFMADSGFGANGTFASGDVAQGAFGGFTAEATPGTKISKVELLVVAYVPVKLGSGEDPTIKVAVNGTTSAGKSLGHDKLNAFTSAATASTVILDITDRRTWKWSDFDNGLELILDQSQIKSGHVIYYDAIGLRVTSATGTDTSGFRVPTSLPAAPQSTANLGNVFNRAVRATDVWNQSPKYLQGQGLTVAVVDSGFEKKQRCRQSTTRQCELQRNVP